MAYGVLDCGMRNKRETAEAVEHFRARCWVQADDSLASATPITWHIGSILTSFAAR
jgi:hypothetical protein